MRLRLERGRGLRLADRAEPFFELQDDTLGRLLADPGDGLKAGRVLERDRTTALVRGGARDDRPGDLGADPLDGEQQLEALAHGGLGKAEAVQRSLTPAGIGYERS